MICAGFNTVAASNYVFGVSKALFPLAFHANWSLSSRVIGLQALQGRQSLEQVLAVRA